MKQRSYIIIQLIAKFTSTRRIGLRSRVKIIIRKKKYIYVEQNYIYIIYYY